ncbi:Galactose oxidase, central domain [Thermoplasmatales archaeon SCGC AB-540-F20]|nr:Galactose oxidase, central domain [Thermoplasmatales archaeon SCGC AB-540-F20]
MAYDSAADRVILFGGDNHAPDSLGDTWVYDFNNNTWYNMTPTVTVIDGPMPSGGIYAHSMVYDEANDLTVLFGGYADPGAASTFRINWTYVYYYDNNTWVNRTPSMTVIGGNLIPRSSPSMVYDSNAECAVMFGGRRSGTQDDILNETWLYKASDNTWYYVNYRTSNDDILWGR